jgi:hypothetical protein
MESIEAPAREPSDKIRVFALAYVGPAAFNKAAAARISSPKSRCHRALGFELYQAAKWYIDELLDDAGLSPRAIVAQLTEIAEFEPGDLLDAKGKFSIVRAKRLGLTHHIHKIEFYPSKIGGGIKVVEFSDRLKALELLAREQGMLTDNIKHSGEISEGLILLREALAGPEGMQSANATDYGDTAGPTPGQTTLGMGAA